MSQDLSPTQFFQKLKEFKHIGITAPAGADGDSVGTQCALYDLILQANPAHRVRIINEEACPERYMFLPRSRQFEVSSAISDADAPQLMICVDGGASRIGPETTRLWKLAFSRAQVDHHLFGGGDQSSHYDFRLYDPKVAATTVLVHRVFTENKLRLTADVAQALYVGLVFDTGQFKHSNTTPETLLIAAQLMTTGFNHTETVEKAMLIRNRGAFELKRRLLSGAQFELGGRYVWGVLSHSDLVAAGAVADDREGLIDHLFLTDRCEIAGFYFEKNPGEWKISFRSRGHNVAQLAQSLNAQGGGHTAAAGCNLSGPQEKVLDICHRGVKAVLNSQPM